MQTALYFTNKRYSEKEFSKEKDLEELIFKIYKNLFDQNGIIIKVKKKIGHKTLGGTKKSCLAIKFTSNNQIPRIYFPYISSL